MTDKKRAKCSNCGANMNYANGSLTCPRGCSDRPIKGYFETGATSTW